MNEYIDDKKIFKRYRPDTRTEKFMIFCANRWVSSNNRFIGWCWFKLTRIGQVIHYRTWKDACTVGNFCILLFITVMAVMIYLGGVISGNP